MFPSVSFLVTSQSPIRFHVVICQNVLPCLCFSTWWEMLKISDIIRAKPSKTRSPQRKKGHSVLPGNKNEYTSDTVASSSFVLVTLVPQLKSLHLFIMKNKSYARTLINIDKQRHLTDFKVRVGDKVLVGILHGQNETSFLNS